MGFTEVMLSLTHRPGIMPIIIIMYIYHALINGFSLALKDDRIEQCLRSCGSEFQMWGPNQEKARKP